MKGTYVALYRRLRHGKPVPAAEPHEPVVHDFTTPYWGHDLALGSVGGGRLVGCAWSEVPLHVGDFLRWRTPHSFSVTTARVMVCDRMRDPSDQYRLTVEVVHRKAV